MTNATLRTTPSASSIEKTLNLLDVGRTAEGESAADGGAGTAPQATSSTSYGITAPDDVRTRCPFASTSTSAAGEKVAPAAVASAESSNRRASPSPNASVTESGRYQKCGSGATSSTLTRVSASARRARAASSAATPPPAMSTLVALLPLMASCRSRGLVNGR